MSVVNFVFFASVGTRVARWNIGPIFAQCWVSPMIRVKTLVLYNMLNAKKRSNTASKRYWDQLYNQ